MNNNKERQFTIILSEIVGLIILCILFYAAALIIPSLVDSQKGAQSEQR